MALSLVLSSCGAGSASQAATAANQAPREKEEVLIGVSGPLTGDNAEYGKIWRKGFDLALDEVNARGGVQGRPLKYVFEDTQSDPKQTPAVAQKFVANEKMAVRTWARSGWRCST